MADIKCRYAETPRQGGQRVQLIRVEMHLLVNHRKLNQFFCRNPAHKLLCLTVEVGWLGESIRVGGKYYRTIVLSDSCREVRKPRDRQ